MKNFFVSCFLFIFVLTSFNIVFIPTANAALQPGTYTIKNILAHDPAQHTKHPKTVEDILKYVNSGGNVEDQRSSYIRQWAR